MMFDVRRGMFVVRECARQCPIMMRLRIIPIQSLPTLVNAVTVRLDGSSREIQVFPNAEHNVASELQAAIEFGDGRPKADHDQRRAFD